MTSSSVDTFVDRVLRQIDGDGRIRQLIKSGDLLGLGNREHDLRQHLVVLAKSLTLFAKVGWAVSMEYAPLDTLGAAIKEHNARGIHAAEELLAEGWGTKPSMLSALGHHLHKFVPVDDEQRVVFEHRARLVRRAWDHHENGAFEASIPIVLAQVEGLTADAWSGKLFFSRRADKQAAVVDSNTLAGMDECLPVVREWFSDKSDTSTASGGGGRHAVLHGREVLYDNKVNSTKVFALLAAVMEHTRPLIVHQADLRRADREARFAGSNDVDEVGRRLDRRGFPEATAMLREIASAQFINRAPGGQFAGRPSKAPDNNQTFRFFLSEDRERWWAWTRTVSGWTFGIACAGQSRCEWRFDGPQPPEAGPWDEPGWVDEDDASPNWLEEEVLFP